MFKKNLQEVEQLIQNDPDCVGDLFYDWFCSTKSLNRRATSLLKKVNFIVETLNLDKSKIKITMKNNCPLKGDLFDSFWIENIETERDIWVAPKLGYQTEEFHNKCQISLFDEKEYLYINWREFKKELKNNSELKQKIKEILL